jgi:hypothetical protein
VRCSFDFQRTIAAPDGTEYIARACGGPAGDGTGRWHGWIEFVPTDGARQFERGARSAARGTPEDHRSNWRTRTAVFARTSAAAAGRVDVVTASNTVPVIWPLVTINGRGYMDGGFYSIDNADLATGCDRVLMITLPARLPPLHVWSLDAAVHTLRSRGALVEVVHPDEATQAVLASTGSNLLDPSIREPAARAGREHGRRVSAGSIAALWRGRR